jgi:hypothetical protein
VPIQDERINSVFLNTFNTNKKMGSQIKFNGNEMTRDEAEVSFRYAAGFTFEFFF